MLPIEQLKTMSETGRATARQLAEVALGGNENVFRINIDALQEFVKIGSEQLKETYSELAQAHTMDVWPQVIMGNIQRSTALNLNLIEITRRMQQELACAVEQHLRALRDGTLDAVDQYAAVAKVPQNTGRKARSNERQLKQAA